MRWFHRHNWKILESQQLAATYSSIYGEYTRNGVGQILQCECGRKRGRVVFADSISEVNVGYMEEVFKGMAF